MKKKYWGVLIFWQKRTLGVLFSGEYLLTVTPVLTMAVTPEAFPLPRKFYIRRNNNKVDSIKKGSIVIAHVLP